MLARSRQGSPPRDRKGEALLMARVRLRDLRAFEGLYRQVRPGLSRFLTAVIRRPPLVEEVLNDTMMVVWERADTFKGESALSTWIYAIAYRKALKALRRSDPPVKDDEGARAGAESDPEASAGFRGKQRMLAAAMESLSADHRAVVDLTYFQELGYREIAEIMECPVDTVKTRMFHARRRLKTMLAGDKTDWL